MTYSAFTVVALERECSSASGMAQQGKVLATQTRQPEFNPQNPFTHGGRELTPKRCR